MNIDQSLIDDGKKYQKGGFGKIVALFAVVLFSIVAFVSAGVAAEQLFLNTKKVSELNVKYSSATESGSIQHIAALPVDISKSDVVCGDASAPYVKVPTNDGTNFYLSETYNGNDSIYKTSTLKYLTTPCGDNYTSALNGIGPTGTSVGLIATGVVFYALSIISFYLLIRPKKSRLPVYGAKAGITVLVVKPQLTAPLRTSMVLSETGITLMNGITYAWSNIATYTLTTVFSCTALLLSMRDESENILIFRDFDELIEIYNNRKTAAVVGAVVPVLSEAVTLNAGLKDVNNDRAISGLMNALKANGVKSKLRVSGINDLLLNFILKWAVLFAPFSIFSFVYGQSRHAIFMPIAFLPLIGIAVIGILFLNKRDRLSYKILAVYKKSS